MSENHSSQIKIVVLTALLTAGITLSSTLFGAYYNNKWSFDNQNKISKSNSQRQVFSELMGHKRMTTQLYVSRFEAMIFSDFHEARWRIAEYPKESIDLKEAQRWMRLSEELVIEIAKSNQSLFKTIGLIITLFPNTSKLDGLVNRIYHHKVPKISVEWDKINNYEELILIKEKAVTDLQKFVEENYGEPIDELLDLLSSEIAVSAK